MSQIATPAPAPDLSVTDSILELSDISKRFGAVKALSDVTLAVRKGEIHCLLGENGAGKSTLCNIVFGVVRPDTGTMRFGGEPFWPSGPAACLTAGIAMVHQHFSVIGNLTVVENLMLGQTKGRLDHAAYAQRIRDISNSYDIEIAPHRLVEDLSVGERQKVEIVKCLMRQPKLLVLDEPTAVLLPHEVDALLAVCRKVAAAGCGVLLVTHKLAEISRIADRTTVMRGGKVVQTTAMQGVDMKALVRAMIGRDLASLDDAVAGTLGVDAEDSPPIEHASAGRSTKHDPMAAEVLRLKDVRFRDKDGAVRLDGINLAVKPGEIVGLAGVEGNGQTELGAILAGLARPAAGQLMVAGKDLTGASPKALTMAGVGIVPEDRHATGCITAMSVAENLFLGALNRFSTFGILRREAMEKAAALAMRDYDVRAAGPTAPMSSLSGGNQQKAVLARELSLEPLAFILAAQPTRGLDIGAVEAVYSRLRAARAAGTGVLLISSELDELLAVADRIEVIYRGRIVGTLPAHPSQRDAIGTLMAGGVKEEAA